MQNESTQHKSEGEPRYSKWSQTQELFVQSYIQNRRSFTDEEGTKVIYAFAGVLGDILHEAAAAAKVKDNWVEQQFYLNVYGVTVLMPSKRTNTGFNFGFEPRGFFFEVAPRYMRNLRFMGDDFWSTFIGLCNQTNFELVCHERPYSRGGAEKKLANKKSQLFSLLRDYILFELEDSELGTPAFATLTFYWLFDIAWEALLQDLSGIFKAVWKLDYALWKVSYQKDNKLKNLG